MSHISLSVSLPAQLLQRLTAVAESEGRPLSWLVRDALSSYLSSLQTETGEDGGVGDVY